MVSLPLGNYIEESKILKNGKGIPEWSEDPRDRFMNGLEKKLTENKGLLKSAGLDVRSPVDKAKALMLVYGREALHDYKTMAEKIVKDYGELLEKRECSYDTNMIIEAYRANRAKEMDMLRNLIWQTDIESGYELTKLSLMSSEYSPTEKERELIEKAVKSAKEEYKLIKTAIKNGQSDTLVEYIRTSLPDIADVNEKDLTSLLKQATTEINKLTNDYICNITDISQYIPQYVVKNLSKKTKLGYRIRQAIKKLSGKDSTGTPEDLRGLESAVLETTLSTSSIISGYIQHLAEKNIESIASKLHNMKIKDLDASKSEKVLDKIKNIKNQYVAYLNSLLVPTLIEGSPLLGNFQEYAPPLINISLPSSRQGLDLVSNIPENPILINTTEIDEILEELPEKKNSKPMDLLAGGIAALGWVGSYTGMLITSPLVTAPFLLIGGSSYTGMPDHSNPSEPIDNIQHNISLEQLLIKKKKGISIDELWLKAHPDGTPTETSH